MATKTAPRKATPAARKTTPPRPTPALMPAKKTTAAAKATVAADRMVTAKTAAKAAPAKATRERKEYPTLDWSNAQAPTIAEYTRVTGTRFDVEKEIPKLIRDGVDESFAKYDPAANKGKGQVCWMTFTAPNATFAAEFKRLAQKYGRYRTNPIDGSPEPVTVRCTDQSPTVVRYNVKPFETRVRKS